jgi:hypothetical protein
MAFAAIVLLSIANPQSNKMLRFRHAFTAVIMFLLLHAIAIAQDNHYSSMQFGSRNSVLYNAGLSGFEDQSAVILNPATLSAATTSSFNFNTNAVGFNNIQFKDGLGKGFTVRNSNINILPSMASGVIKPKNLGRSIVLGYALYHSNTDNLDFANRAELKTDIINNTESPGSENYLAQYYLNTKLDEVSTVLGAGWRIGKHVSLGVSQTFLYRSQQYRDNFTANVLPERNAGASVSWIGTSYDIDARYYRIMTYTKLGLTAKAGEWNLGVVLTMPNLGIMGSGEMMADLSLINVRLPNAASGPRNSYMANGRFEKLKVTYKNPLSMQLGASRRFGNAIVYGGLSWYASVKEYTVMTPGEAPFLQPATSDNVLYTDNVLRVWDRKRAVLNASIAADWIVRPDYHLLFSVRNDNHSFEGDRSIDGFSMPKKNWNNYHLTLGTQRDFGSSEWVVGLRFNTGGRDDYPQPFSFADPTEDNLFQGDRKTGKITSSGLQLLLSYTFKFGGKDK